MQNTSCPDVPRKVSMIQASSIKTIGLSFATFGLIQLSWPQSTLVRQGGITALIALELSYECCLQAWPSGLVLVGLESKTSTAVKSSLEVFHLEKFVVMMSQSHPFLCYLHIFDNESHKNESKGQKVPTAISETASWSEKQPILEVCPTLSKKHVWSQIRWMYAPFNPTWGVFWNGDW